MVIDKLGFTERSQSILHGKLTYRMTAVGSDNIRVTDIST